MMTMAAPSSMAKPRDGVITASFTPMARMILYPYNSRPKPAQRDGAQSGHGGKVTPALSGETGSTASASVGGPGRLIATCEKANAEAAEGQDPVGVVTGIRLGGHLAILVDHVDACTGQAQHAT